jgi:anti-sigma B factor antagonist
MQKLKFTTETVRKSWIVRVRGSVSKENARQLRAQLFQAAEQPGPALLLDLSHVVEMDSSGVAVLIELHKHLNDSVRPLVLVGESDAVKQIIQVLKAQNVICDVVKSIDEGVKKTRSLKPPAAAKS